MSIPIIGRATELEFINSLVREKDTQRVLCIEGAGGIGKTRLLQEVYRLYKDTGQVTVVGILDFDDLALSSSHGISRKIVEILQFPAIFTDYLDEFKEFRLLQQAGWSGSAIDRKQSKLQNAFFECLNKFAQNNRLVFLFDTTERVPAGEALDFIINSLCNLQNAIVVFAGRSTPMQRIQEVLDSGDRILLIKLESLNETNSELYLEEKQRALKIVLPLEVRRQLILLSGGSPILLEMAIEWIVQGEPPDWSWLAETTYEKLADLALVERQLKQKEFEARLVHRIYEFRGLKGLEPFVLALSIAYPLDVRGISYVMDIPQARAEMIFDYARQQVYVKTLPSNFISLHDRMRDLVEEYVWQVEDQRGERRRDIHRRMVLYLRSLVSDVRENLRALSQTDQDGKTEDPRSNFVYHENLGRQLHSIWEIQLISHLSQISPREAFDDFIAIFDQAQKDYRTSDCDTLLSKISDFGFHESLSASERFELDRRRASFYIFYSNQFDKAQRVLDPYVEKMPDEKEKQVDILRFLGNIQIRKGLVKDSIREFNLALEICKKEHITEKLVEVEAALGWAYRHLSDWEESAKHYTEALRLCHIAARYDELFVSLHTSLALPLGYLQQSQALSLCAQAIDHSNRLGSQRALGISYATSGCVFYQFGRVSDSLDALEKALRIFEISQDDEQLSWVLNWKGVALWATGDLTEAERTFDKALKLNVISHRPQILGRLGRIYFDQKNYERAQEIWEESYDLSRQLTNPLFELCGIRDLAGIAREERRFDMFEDYKLRLDQYENEYPGQYKQQHALGGTRINIGLLALGHGSLQDAKQYIAQGLEVFITLGRYGIQDVGYYLQRLVNQINSIDVTQSAKQELGDGLRSYWLAPRPDYKDGSLFNAHPEAIWFFDQFTRSN